MLNLLIITTNILSISYFLNLLRSSAFAAEVTNGFKLSHNILKSKGCSIRGVIKESKINSSNIIYASSSALVYKGYYEIL